MNETKRVERNRTNASQVIPDAHDARALAIAYMANMVGVVRDSMVYSDGVNLAALLDALK